MGLTAALRSVLLLQQTPKSASLFLRKQFPGACLYHLTLVQDYYAVCSPNCGKAVGDNDHGEFAMKPLDGILDALLVFRIQRAGCLIKKQ